jgi:ankyrin repeat protein
LALAALHNQPDTLECLLGFGANLHLKSGPNSETALHLAAKAPDGNKCVVYLIKSGARTSVKDAFGLTPRDVAYAEGHVKNLAYMTLDEGNE